MTNPITLSESQWNTVMQTVHDEALKARVAASFLPLFGPLDGDVQTVPRNIFEISDDGHMEVLDYENVRLATLSVNVSLKNAQLADPELTSAMIMFRRAAEIMARVEDAIIFNGQSGVDGGPNDGVAKSPGMQNVFKVGGGEPSGGLLEAGSGNAVRIEPPDPKHDKGQRVFSGVVEAINKIEGKGFHGPFACVLGDELFTAINTPMPNSMVLPRDAILPFLDAPLLRSSALPPKEGLLVSLRGAPVEIVVPSDITVRHLTTTPEAKHVFRVQQKFVLRVKEAEAVARLHT
ncbi:MAG: encapsulin [Boseongicola sp.]